MFHFLFLTVRIFINDQNVNEVIEKSYNTPIFCVFFSPNCPPCRMMHPFWLQLMNKYAFDPNIIVAECESYTNHVAARKLLYFQTFPTYGLIIKGRGMILQNVERTFKGFKSKAEEIKKININDKCQYFNNSPENFPAIVLEQFNGEIIDCSFLNQLSKMSGIPPSHFYLSAPSSQHFGFSVQPKRTIKIFYSKEKSIKYNGKRKTKQISKFIRDQFDNPPLCDWNLNFPHKSQRKNVIIVYSKLNSIENFYDFAYERSDRFAFSKIRYSVLNSSFHFLSLNDLPAMIFPDLDNGTCSVFKNIDTMMNLRVSFENNRFGKSDLPFKSFYWLKSIGFMIIGPVILCIVVIFIIIKKSRPQKTE